MKRLLIHWIIVAASLFVTTRLVDGVHVASLSALAVAAAVLGLVNALIRPALSLLALPLTVLTLGLFYLVVNALCFGIAAYAVAGFSVTGPVPALLGALVTSLVSGALGFVAGED